MKITSTTLSKKKNLKRAQPYHKKKVQPGVVKKVRSNFDPDVVDLTDIINLADVTVSKKTKQTAKTKEERREIVQDILVEISTSTKKMKKLAIKAPAQKASGESLMMLFSDWHFGKLIKTRSGHEIFNSDIATNRVEEEIPTQFETFLKNKSNCKAVEELVIVFAGDIVDNDIIYPTQRLGIDSGVAVQFTNSINAIMNMLSKFRILLDKYVGKDTPIRLECLTGNHGRAGKDSETPVCSWDTAVYAALDLALRTAGAKNITVSFSLEDYNLINVRGHRGLVVHHAPPQSESPGSKKFFGGMYEIFDYDFMLYGDLHHWAASCYNGKPLLMNGSLCGYDDYAIGLAVRDDWSQYLITVTDKDVTESITRFKRGE
jgi:hypothetical protein